MRVFKYATTTIYMETWKHGNPMGFTISQNFITFGVHENFKLLQLSHVLATSCIIGMEE
jgi:hypothetical protein